jgi:oligogalacturonide transporter
MWRSIAFGVTDLMGGGYGALIGAYLMFFFTTFCNLNPLEAGTIIGLAKIVDSITAIIMGKLSDAFWKTKLGRKYGRRHFFLLIGSPIILIVYSLLWIPGIGFWYYLGIYCLVEVAVTMVMIPYETLPSEMTTDYNERSKMSTTRMFFSGSITSIVTLVGGIVISIMGDKNAYAYTVIGITFAIIFAIAILITYKFTWERPVSEIQALQPKVQEGESAPSRNVFVMFWVAMKAYFSTLKVKAFRQHMYIYLLGVTAQDLFSGAFIYFIVFGYNLSTSTASWLVILCLGGYYWMYLLKMSEGMLIIMLAILSTIYLFFKGGAYSIPWNVFPFIPDVDEIMTSQRREGEFAAMMNFIRKVTSGIASVVLGWILAENGFKTGATTQSPQAINAIVLTLVFGTGILTLIALLLAITFKLDVKTHKVLIGEINRLKAGGKKADVTPEAKKVAEELTGVDYSKLWPAAK